MRGAPRSARRRVGKGARAVLFPRGQNRARAVPTIRQHGKRSPVGAGDRFCPPYEVSPKRPRAQSGSSTLISSVSFFQYAVSALSQAFASSIDALGTALI